MNNNNLHNTNHIIKKLLTTLSITLIFAEPITSYSMTQQAINVQAPLALAQHPNKKYRQIRETQFVVSKSAKNGSAAYKHLINQASFENLPAFDKALYSELAQEYGINIIIHNNINELSQNAPLNR